MINPYSEETQLKRLKSAALPYDFMMNRVTMASQAKQLWDDVFAIKAEYCPDDFAQASFTLHPDFCDQGHFPDQLLQHFGMFCLGTRAVKLAPRSSYAFGDPDKERVSLSIITIAKRPAYLTLVDRVESIKPDTLLGYQLRYLESIEATSSGDRLMIPDDYKSSVYLVGVYVRPGETSNETGKQFTAYANKYGFEVRPDFVVQKGGIFYLLIKGSKDNLDAISQHPLVATIQEPPKAKK